MFAGDVQVPRPAPEYVISYPGSKQDLLSRYKGKVVALSFIFTTCPHCQVECQMLSKLYSELGPKGFQPLAVAVNPMAIMLVPDFVRDYHVNFPVGASEQPPALSFLKIGPADRWVVPQLAIIDRKGNIRAQTPYNGDEKLQNEGHVRQLIEGLLNEGAKPVKAKPKKTS
jgi:peroxiredoxin